MPSDRKANTRQKRAAEAAASTAEVEAPAVKRGKIALGSKASQKAAAAAAASAAEAEAEEEAKRSAAEQGKIIADAAELEERKKQTLEQLRAVERQLCGLGLMIYNLESQYFENTNAQGNALRGYEGLISSMASNNKKSQFKAEDRIFSTSSVTGTPML
eukprot:gene3754-13815_t